MVWYYPPGLSSVRSNLETKGCAFCRDEELIAGGRRAHSLLLYMADYYALTGNELPLALHGVDGEFSIRTLSDRERLSIEDYFFRKQVKVSLSPGTTVVVVPQNQAVNTSMEDFAVLVEFALGILSVSGFQPITTV